MVEGIEGSGLMTDCEGIGGGGIVAVGDDGVVGVGAGLLSRGRLNTTALKDAPAAAEAAATIARVVFDISDFGSEVSNAR